MGPISAFLLAVCAAAQGQDAHPRPEPELEPSAPLQGRHAVLHGGGRARASFPLNSMDSFLPIHVPVGPSLYSFSGSFKWSDFFKPGLGGVLDLDLIWEDMGAGDAPPAGDEWAIGPFASVGFDRFQGRTAVDAQGATIEPEDLRAVTVLVGPKLVKQFTGGFFLDGRLGLGAVHYSRVDAQVQTVGLGAQSFEGDFFKSGVSFAMELDVHAGLWMGRTALVVGGGLRILSAPEGGRRVEISSTSMLAFAVDLGIELGF